MSETFLKEEPPLDIWSIFKTITSQIIWLTNYCYKKKKKKKEKRKITEKDFIINLVKVNNKTVRAVWEKIS